MCRFRDHRSHRKRWVLHLSLLHAVKPNLWFIFLTRAAGEKESPAGPERGPKLRMSLDKKRSYAHQCLQNGIMHEQLVGIAAGRLLCQAALRAKRAPIERKMSRATNYSSGPGREIADVDSFSSAVFRSKSILSKIYHPHSISKKRDTGSQGINHIPTGSSWKQIHHGCWWRLPLLKVPFPERTLETSPKVMGTSCSQNRDRLRTGGHSTAHLSTIKLETVLVPQCKFQSADFSHQYSSHKMVPGKSPYPFLDFRKHCHVNSPVVLKSL